MSSRPKLVLASASPRRRALLEQAGCAPDALLATDIDETPRRGETARTLVQRLASGKLEAALSALASRNDLQGAYTICADTVVACTGRILPKAETLEDAAMCLRLLSGRGHYVLTAVCVAAPGGRTGKRLVETRLRFKNLSSDDVSAYLASGEWRGKAGGYAIQGLAGMFVSRLIGSYTNVVGLPLYETMTLLHGQGFPIHTAWAQIS